MESDNSQSEEEYIGGFSERVVQFIPDYISDNQNKILSYINNLNKIVASGTQGSNSIMKNEKLTIKDFLNSNVSSINFEVVNFLKSLNDDVFVVTHFFINKFQNNVNHEKFRLLDNIANLSFGFEYEFKRFNKKFASKKTNQSNQFENNKKNPFEDSLVTILLGTKRRLISKEKVIFIHADYHQIIKLQRYDVLNLLYIISSCFLVNCLEDVEVEQGFDKDKIVQMISKFKDSITSNIQYKTANLKDFNPHLIFVYDKSSNEYTSNLQDESLFESSIKDDIFDKIDFVCLSKKKLFNSTEENQINVILSDLSNMIYSDMNIKYYKSKHFTGITIYLLSAFLPFYVKYSDMKIEKMYKF